MVSARQTESEPHEEGFDYSTAEGMQAVELALDLALDIRRELKSDPTQRKIALYERTLGLAVIPVLLRRLLIQAKRLLSSNAAGGK